MRDLARFGQLYLQRGVWQGRRLLSESLIDLALTSVVPLETPRTAGREAAMLPGQRSIGGGKDIVGLGPGTYSFNWWLNGPDALGRQGGRSLPGAPLDLFYASGHGGRRALWVLPTEGIVVSWNDARWASRKDERPTLDAARLMAAAAV